MGPTHMSGQVILPRKLRPADPAPGTLQRRETETTSEIGVRGPVMAVQIASLRHRDIALLAVERPSVSLDMSAVVGRTLANLLTLCEFDKYRV